MIPLPSPLALFVLILAGYRLTRLAGWDTFPLAEKTRAWVTGEYEVGGVAIARRPTIDHLIHCPFCIGWWICLATYLAWLSAPTAIMYAAVPLAMSGVVGLVSKNLDP